MTLRHARSLVLLLSLGALSLGAVACSSGDAAKEAKKPEAEALLRTEFATWKGTPYAESGEAHTGVGNTGFVRVVMRGALGLEIPARYDDQLRTGKLAERDALVPGDLVFFEGQGIGPFRSRTVAIFLGHDEIALAQKPSGVTLAKLTDKPWTTSFKTARHIPTDPAAGAPVFDAKKYGTNRSALLRDIATAWKGTLYRQGGTTFDGIGNDEFVREVYGAIYDTELEGTPSNWATMGEAVDRKSLEAGDIVLYEAVGIGKVFNQRHAGLYIGDGDFVHAVKGSAVTISKLDDPRWSAAFRAARRINPDALAREQQARPALRAAAKPAQPRVPAPATRPATAAARPGAPAPAPAPSAGTTATPTASATDSERRLRDAAERWRGTPYMIGGTTKSGVDCSAFVRAIYTEVYNVELPRTAEEQEHLGKTIDQQHLEPGDLVFFRTQGMGPLFRSRHVGLYLGAGEFAQASGSKGVTVSRLDDYYWSRKYSTARRLSR